MMDEYFQSLIANCASKWRPIPGYEGLYDVSLNGEVRSLDREVWEQRGRIKSRNLRGKSLSPVHSADAYKYKTVALCKLGKPKHCHIHTLVAEAFIGKRPVGHVVDHIDGNPLNNNLSNLRYCTVSINLGKLDARSRPLVGTSFNKRRGLYRAYIQINNKEICLGYYNSRNEAVAVRRKKEIELRGNDAPIRGDK